MAAKFLDLKKTVANMAEKNENDMFDFRTQKQKTVAHHWTMQMAVSVKKVCSSPEILLPWQLDVSPLLSIKLPRIN